MRSPGRRRGRELGDPGLAPDAAAVTASCGSTIAATRSRSTGPYWSNGPSTWQAGISRRMSSSTPGGRDGGGISGVAARSRRPVETPLTSPSRPKAHPAGRRPGPLPAPLRNGRPGRPDDLAPRRPPASPGGRARPRPSARPRHRRRARGHRRRPRHGRGLVHAPRRAQRGPTGATSEENPADGRGPGRPSDARAGHRCRDS